MDLSAQYIVDNDVAPVMSDSDGACELDMGAAGKRFYNQLRQQAAAESGAANATASRSQSLPNDPTFGVIGWVNAEDVRNRRCDVDKIHPVSPFSF